MTLIGIDHIQLAMPKGKEELARSFFGDLLQLEEVVKPSELQKRGGCWFRSSPQTDGTSHGVAIHVGVEEAFSPARKAHAAFLVEGLEAMAQRLESHGATVKWDDAIPELRRFYTEDPFGNRIEMIEAADAGFTHTMPKQHRME